MHESHANADVLEFYRQLPFNYYGSTERAAAAIKKSNAIAYYPALTALLQPGTRVLDVGCGAGWATNSMNFFHRTEAGGIDFNPVALDQARAVARHLGTAPNFTQADLFTHVPEPLCDVVVSLGVLHHTNNCLAAIRHLCRHCVRPGGHLFVGLYHLHGRKPFLDHFARLRNDGRTEEELFREYRRLHPVSTDEVFLRSWFRDQVLHPHETQHTLEEILPLLQDCGMDFVSSSINGFASDADLPALFAKEKTLEEVGQARLRERKYYPGFFLFLARRRDE